MSTKVSALVTLLATSALSLGFALPSFARPATLNATDVNSRINVRSAPSVTAKAMHFGVVGDRIEVLRTVSRTNDMDWHYVRFGSSGAEGWVRVDFIRYAESDTSRYAILGSQRLLAERGDRINIRSAPSTQATSPHFGIAGDIVKVLSSSEGKDGYVWQYIQFPSGAKGWVRGDLVRFDEEGC
jgi:Bacterial SH3 domain